MTASAPIGVAAFGVSTPFAYWGFAALYEVVRLLTGGTLRLHLGAMSELRTGFAARGGGSVVITSDLPEAELCRFLCGSDLPLFAFADSIEDMVDWAKHSRSIPHDQAVRFCSQVFSALTPAFIAPRTLILGPQTPPCKIVRTVVEHIKPGLGEAHGQEIYDMLVAEGLLTPGPPDWRNEPELEKVEEEKAHPEDLDSLRDMNTSLTGYTSIFESWAPKSIEWTRTLFTYPDADHWREAIDLTGPARTVMYGPYLHLPVGSWIARVEFEIDGAVSGVEAATDVFMSEVLVQKVFEMPTKGIFAYELAFHVSDPRHPIEIRLFTKRSAIEGLLLVRSVQVRAA